MKSQEIRIYPLGTMNIDKNVMMVHKLAVKIFHQIMSTSCLCERKCQAVTKVIRIHPLRTIMVIMNNLCAPGRATSEETSSQSILCAQQESLQRKFMTVVVSYFR